MRTASTLHSTDDIEIVLFSYTFIDSVREMCRLRQPVNNDTEMIGHFRKLLNINWVFMFSFFDISITVIIVHQREFSQQRY